MAAVVPRSRAGRRMSGRLWLEALTPKQALLFSLVALEYGVGLSYVTTRRYDVVSGIPRRLGVEVFEVGSYGGSTLREKLLSSIERQRRLLDLAVRQGPSVHVAFVSPDSVRVAFGLGIPVVTMSDTPHSDAVSRLTIPLARVHVAPRVVLDDFSRYSGLTRLVGFDGVFEAAWVRRFSPDRGVVRALGLGEWGYVFIRPPESKAYYYMGASGGAEEAVYRIAAEALGRGLDVLVYPRYPEQREAFSGLGGGRGRVVFLEEATDTLSLEYFSRLVVTGGATMATESALLGTPSIYLFPRRLKVPSYVAGRGFPLHHVVEPGEAVRLAVELMGADYDREGYLERARRVFEDPVPLVVGLVKDLSS